MRHEGSDRAPSMRKTQFKNHNEVIDTLYRLVGHVLAIKFILDPLANDCQDLDRPFAVSKIAEAMDRDIHALLEAADEPNPVLFLRAAGDDEGGDHEA